MKLPPSPVRLRRRVLPFVRHCDLWGAQRQTKYDWLDAHHTENTGWTILEPAAPHYLFIPQDTRRLKEYERGWSITEMMPVNVLGFQSHRDGFAVSFDKHEIESRLVAFRLPQFSDAHLKQKFSLQDNRDWKLVHARKELQEREDWRKPIMRCLYRPFDKRWCYFDEIAMDYPRRELKLHVAKKDNLVMLL